MKEIAVVGGGPAGAMCGEQLARAGCSVSILDEHLAWEKPCGGGLTHKAIEAYPFLAENCRPKKFIHEVELISSADQRALLKMTHPIVIYSRAVLNGLLLDRAAESGCRIERSHVAGIDTKSEKPRYCVDGEWRTADFLVLAAGARGRFAMESHPLEQRDLEMTQGYFVPSSSDLIQIKF
ncbi:MAG TPA: FAD-dependent monooxygenase, partial [Methylomirabilota bacterium]|nr:FAD-dependent monooxygenase [Methylomirabilota bacterium]